jgi:hypothetical protein
MPRDIRLNFSSGEMAPEYRGRRDLQKVQASMNFAKNCYVKPSGPVLNREGMEHINFAYDDSDEIRLIPFEFNTVQTYVLEFGEKYMRVFRDGGLVLDPNNADITDATQTDPVEITTSSSHGYSNGDWVFIQDVDGMTEINNRFFIIKNVTSTTFELTDMYNNNIDGTGFGAYSSGGKAFVVPVFTTPYNASDLFDIRFTQSNDVMILTHPDYDVRELTRSDHHIWNFSISTFEPTIGSPSGVSATNSNGTGSVTYTYVVTAISDENGDESLPSSEVSTTNDLSSSGSENTIDWSSKSGALEYNVYKEDNGLFGFIGTTRDTSFVDDRIKPDLSDSPPDANDPFSAANSKPGAVTFHQQRVVYGRSNNSPQRLWASKTGAFTNFTSKTPPADDDAFSFVINANQVNAIQHLVSMNGLLIFTTGGEWLGTGGNEPFTPNSFRAERQTNHGSPVPGQGFSPEPLVIGNTILFVSNNGKQVRDMGFELQSDSFISDDLTIFVPHLFEDASVKEWTSARDPNNLIHVIRDDGKGLFITYMRERNADVWGWTRFETDGSLKSITTIEENNREALYAVVERTANGNKHKFIERLAKRDFTQVEGAFFVDAGLSLNSPTAINDITQADPGVVTTATSHGLSNGDLVVLNNIVGMDSLNRGRFTVQNVTSTTFELADENGNSIDTSEKDAYESGGEVRKGVDTLGGLSHLEGRDVAILADGSVLPQKTVQNGEITLDNKFGWIHVGLPYETVIETTDLDFNALETFGLERRPSRMKLNVLNSRGLEVGPDLDNMNPVPQRQFESLGSPIDLKSGFVDALAKSRFSERGSLFMRQTNPLPMQILGIVVEASVENGS